MAWVKLTALSGKAVYVNLRNARTMRWQVPDEDQPRTTIDFGITSEDEISVKETPDAIMSMVEAKNHA
jgi:hypothetical protein